METVEVAPVASPGGFLVDRTHPVTASVQLAARLECEIRDGRRAGHEVLPAIRTLAHELGVHRHTVASAYARLRRRGVVVSRARRRLTAAPEVGPPFPQASRADLRHRMLELVTHGFEQGCARSELEGVFAPWGSGPSVPTLVEPDRGLAWALVAEIRARAGLDVRHGPAPRARPPQGGAGTGAPPANPYVTRAELVERVARRTGAIEVLPLRLVGGGRQLDFAARRPRSVVALVTRSAAIRDFARALAVGAGVRLATPSVDDPPALRRALRIARLVWVDASVAAAGLAPTSVGVEIRPLHLLHDSTIGALVSYLEGQSPPSPEPSAGDAP